MLFRPRNVLAFISIFVVCILFFKPPPLHGASSTFEYLETFAKKFPEISNATLGFQQVFVINLPERSDRRDAGTLAAALSEIDATWIDGVAGQHVLEKVLPEDSADKGISKGNKGSWRAHMNVLQRIVQHNIGSALILEDDADWDVRLKSQLQVFAQAARAFTQRVPGKSQQSFAEGLLPNRFPDREQGFDRLPYTVPARLSPYGDSWDVLWLGHCGTEIPRVPKNVNMSALKVLVPDDPTVPAPRHLKAHPFALQDAIGELYPPHTRVVHLSMNTTCTQAYAVSQRGARKLLWQFGLQTFTTGWDLMLRDWCDGSYTQASTDSTNGNLPTKLPVCVTVQPPLFSQHYGKGAASDITGPGGGFISKKKEMTPYIRLSVRLNMERMVNGAGLEDLVDQWED